MNDGDEEVFLRLLFALTVLAVLVVVAVANLHGLPLIGSLPGDLDLSLLGGRQFLPIGSSILISAVLALLAHLVTLTMKKK